MPKTEELLVGIDGGGTHTRIRIATRDGKRIAERTVNYTCKFFLLGFDDAARRITKLIITTAQAKKIDITKIKEICIGLAGNGRVRDQNMFRRFMSVALESAGLKVNKLRLESDAIIALEGLLNGGKGVVLICGTGAIAIGKTNENKIVRVGGWGRIIGDEGSGYWIGVQGLNAVARALDGRAQKTQITDAIFDSFSFLRKREPREIRSAIYLGKLNVERIAPIVTRCAESGDRIAQNILSRAAEELFDQLKTMYEQYFSRQKNITLVLHGSVAEKTPVGVMLKLQLSKKFAGKYDIIVPATSPLDGAIRLLRK